MGLLSYITYKSKSKHILNQEIFLSVCEEIKVVKTSTS